MMCRMSRIKKVFVFFMIMVVNSITFLYADEEGQWVFAAAEFESNKESDSLSNLIPHYILQNFSQTLTRTVSQEEQYRLEQRAYNDEINALYESLQNKTFERDSLIFTQTLDSDYEDALSEKEKEIESLRLEIQNKINEKNLLHSDSYTAVEKKVVLWNDSTQDLYDIGENVAFFNPKDINALITGSIEHADSFISVTVYVTVYPGSVLEVKILEVDNITSVQDISQRISEQVYLSLSNKEKVEVHFAIEPQEAQATSTIHINGQIIQLEENSDVLTVVLTSGIYEFYIESPGYEGLAATYLFSEGNYRVNLNLKAVNTENLTFDIPSPNGNLFLNAQKAVTDTASQIGSTQGIVSVNGFPALGEFVSEEGITTWFLLTEESTTRAITPTPNYDFTLEADTKNFADIIEKNRKRMYNSYAALIISLPLYFIANGQYLNEYNSWASAKSAGDNLKGWDTARNVTMGVSIGLGVNFLVQLGLYIHSVNSILPEEVDTQEN